MVDCPSSSLACVVSIIVLTVFAIAFVRINILLLLLSVFFSTVCQFVQKVLVCRVFHECC